VHAAQQSRPIACGHAPTGEIEFVEFARQFRRSVELRAQVMHPELSFTELEDISEFFFRHIRHDLRKKLLGLWAQALIVRLDEETHQRIWWLRNRPDQREAFPHQCAFILSYSILHFTIPPRSGLNFGAEAEVWPSLESKGRQAFDSPTGRLTSITRESLPPSCGHRPCRV